VLEGDLTDFTMPEVLRLLAFTSKTGRLLLVTDGREGRVDLVDGRVRDASAEAAQLPLARRVLGAGLVDGDTLLGVLGRREALPTDLELARDLVTEAGAEAGALAQLLREQTYDATFDLLRWTTGTFRFSIDRDARSDGSVLDLALPVDELLEETTRRLEAWPVLAERTGDLTSVVTVRAPRGDGTEVSLSAEGWALLALVDGRRSVGDLVALAGQGEQRTRQALASLLDAGVVEVGAADGSGPIERLLRDHAALAERERALTGVPSADDAVASPAPVTRELEVELASRSDHLAVADDAPEAPVEQVEEVAAVTDIAEAAGSAADAAIDAGGAQSDAPAGTRPLRTRVRTERLRTDPNVDEDLVDRLIEGVEGL
jgi:hypothetical protein